MFLELSFFLYAYLFIFNDLTFQQKKNFHMNTKVFLTQLKLLLKIKKSNRSTKIENKYQTFIKLFFNRV